MAEYGGTLKSCELSEEQRPGRDCGHSEILNDEVKCAICVFNARNGDVLGLVNGIYILSWIRGQSEGPM